MAKQRHRIFPILLFLLGFAIFSYPMISRYYYRIESKAVVADFHAGKSALELEEIEKRMALARAYNASLTGKAEQFHDPYVKDVKEGLSNYAHMLEVREKIGVIRIPSLDIEEPIFAGTSEEVLQKGTGHMELTALPVGGEGNHVVITGHRGLPGKRIFSPLNRMKPKDHFYIENIQETLAYEVDQIKVIEPTHFEDLRPREGKDYVTLLTCTPYMINSHRLLVRGHRIPYVPHEEVAALALRHTHRIYYFLLALVLMFFFGLFFWVYKHRKKMRGKEK